MNQKALLMVGSPKKTVSTSNSLGTFLMERMRKQGFETETLFLKYALKSNEGRLEMLEAVRRADIITIAFPVYLDAPPCLVLKAMELIGNDRKGNESKKQRLLVISNCGFPKVKYNDPSIAICRRFAMETGFEWVGGLGLGGGEVIRGQALSNIIKYRNPIRSLKMTADALTIGDTLPQKAIKLMAKPLVPCWIYSLYAGIRWRMEANEYGRLKNIHDCPYNE